MEDLTSTIGPIMKAARKFKKLNQSEVAKAIGCSQSALSKMEHNLLVPSAPQWFLFSRFTSIRPETLESGFIDRNSSVKFNSDDVSLGFKIPRRYRIHRAEKVRELYPFMKYLRKHFPDELKAFIAESKIDAEFFRDFDNLINFQLLADVIERFIALNRAGYHDVCAMAEDGHDDIFWDADELEWRELKTVDELLTAFVKKQIFFQADFQIITDQRPGKVGITYKPEYHLKTVEDKDGKITQFLNYYRQCMIQNMVKRFLGLTITAEMVPGRQETLGGHFEISLRGEGSSYGA